MRAKEFIEAVNLAYDIYVDKIGEHPKYDVGVADYSDLRLPSHSQSPVILPNADEYQEEFALLTSAADVSNFSIFYELSLLQNLQFLDEDKLIVGFNGSQEMIYCAKGGRMFSYHSAFETTLTVASSPCHFFDLLYAMLIIKWERLEYYAAYGEYSDAVESRYKKLFQILAPSLSGEPRVWEFLSGVL